MTPRSASFVAAIVVVVAYGGPATADPGVSVRPKAVRPGDPVLVMVTGSTEPPRGKAAGAALQFFAARNGAYQAVFATPLHATAEEIAVAIEPGKQAATVQVREASFPETDVIVEDELANPDKADRDRIDADNKAIIESFAKANGELQFSRAFQRPPGRTTSTFGEWRTFNDGHRSQHLGLDLAAREGSKVRAVNAGTVVLVRDCFLAGNVVVVAHGAGIASAYYHLSKVTVVEGATVELGGELGLAGHTGRTTGPHLHVSMRVAGGFVDPASFFKLGLAPARTANALKK